MLRDLLAALDAMPNKRLIDGELELRGEVCALGALGRAKGLPIEKVDPEEHERLGEMFNVAPCLIREVEYLNDEANIGPETPEQRWLRVRGHVTKMLAGVI